MIGHFEQIALGGTAVAAAKQDVRCKELFAELVARQSRFVFRLAFVVLRNSQDAEDVVQEVFLKLYRSGRWQDMKDERAYLARAVWRMAIDRLPKSRESGLPANSASPDKTPEEAAVNANWSAIVHKLMDALPEELRLPLAMSAMEELKSCEIAQLLGIPEGTVRTRIMKARSVLREKLSVIAGDRHGR
jgi:RNA polymerase sigma-70 factor (ECF subfamily)